MTWQMVGKKEGRMKDGTKTGNGICIQTIPTGVGPQIVGEISF